MSQVPSYATEVTPPKKSKGSKFWITASFLVSGTILIWAFSAPFRAGNSSQILSSAPDSGAPELITSADHHRLHASEVRAIAREMDQEFMKQLAERQQQAFPPVPGAEAVKQSWVGRVDRAREELRTLQTARPGSLERAYRDSLAEKLKDAPLE